MHAERADAAPVSELVVRRIEPADWAANRTLRLEALADYPLGFLETLASARAEPDATWHARAARGAVGGDSDQVLAWHEGRPVATCVSFVRDGSAWLAGVFVSPPHRGAGMLGRLVAECQPWVQEQPVDDWLLEVHENNVRARRAYERLGWTATGQTQPYPLPHGGVELMMRRSVARPGS